MLRALFFLLGVLSAGSCPGAWAAKATNGITIFNSVGNPNHSPEFKIVASNCGEIALAKVSDYSVSALCSQSASAYEGNWICEKTLMCFLSSQSKTGTSLVEAHGELPVRCPITNSADITDKKVLLEHCQKITAADCIKNSISFRGPGSAIFDTQLKSEERIKGAK